MLEWDIILCHIRHELRMSHYWYVKSWILFYIRETNLYIYWFVSHKHINIFTKKSSHEYIHKKTSHEYIHKEFSIKKLWVEIQTPYFSMWEETSYLKKSIMLICYILIKINKMRNKGWRKRFVENHKLSSHHLLIGTKK